MDVRTETHKRLTGLLTRRAMVLDEIKFLNLKFADIEASIRKCREIAKAEQFELDVPGRTSAFELLERTGTVRGFVELYLRNIYPEAVDPKSVRHLYEGASGRLIHEQSIRVILRRLLKEGKVEKVGSLWRHA